MINSTQPFAKVTLFAPKKIVILASSAAYQHSVNKEATR